MESTKKELFLLTVARGLLLKQGRYFVSLECENWKQAPKNKTYGTTTFHFY